MIESLFGYAAAADNNKDKKKGSAARKEQPQYIQIIDHKKAQNLSILLRALNVTIDEVRDALLEGEFLIQCCRTYNSGQQISKNRA